MKFKKNYIIIPLVTIVVALLGRYFTNLGMEWYNTELIRPALTPPDYWFSVAWTIIFILTAISAMIVWKKGKGFSPAIKIFIVNAILNVLWSFLFFTMHWKVTALIEMLILLASLLILVRLTWHCCRVAGILLLPYIAWVCFATYLTYVIVLIN